MFQYRGSIMYIYKYLCVCINSFLEPFKSKYFNAGFSHWMPFFAEGIWRIQLKYHISEDGRLRKTIFYELAVKRLCDFRSSELGTTRVKEKLLNLSGVQKSNQHHPQEVQTCMQGLLHEILSRAQKMRTVVKDSNKLKLKVGFRYTCDPRDGFLAGQGSSIKMVGKNVGC